MRQVFLCVLICLQAVLHAKDVDACFRALIVANTRDGRIGNTCVSDAYRVKKSLQAIASQIDIQLQVSILDGRKCRGYDMKEWIVHQRINPNDIVLVYYSGHGGPDWEQGLWPYLSLRDGCLRSAELQGMIKSLPCRLSMLFLDCCNGRKSEPEKRSDSDHYIPVLKRDKPLVGLKSLFKRSRGFMTVCAAARGEQAGCDGRRRDKIWGGYFTTGFIVALKELAKNQDVTWEQVFHRAKEYAVVASCEDQHAIATVETK
jgi:hypothetical protein